MTDTSQTFNSANHFNQDISIVPVPGQQRHQTQIVLPRRQHEEENWAVS